MTRLNFPSGRIPAKTAKSVGFTPSGIAPGGQTAPSNPTMLATIAAVAGASPVTMTVRTPNVLSSEIREVESLRGGSLSAISPMSCMDAAGPAATAKTLKPCFSSSSAKPAAMGDGEASFATTVKAPLRMRSTLPFAPVAVASEVFLAGSNGTNAISFGRSDAGLLVEAERIAASTASSPPSELARAAKPRTWASSNPGSGLTLVTESSLRVSVPVLSAHKTSIVAASSTAVSRVGSTPSFAKDRAPTAAASVNVAGKATGIAARTDVSNSGMISLHGIA